MNISQDKKQMRQVIQERKKSMTSDEIRESDDNIQKNILELEEIKSADTVFCFVSMKDEIQTRPIIDALLKEGKRVGVPKCIKGNNLRVYEIKSFSDLKKGFFGIEEPLETCIEIYPEQIDTAIIPCTSCDRNGNRLGKGGGYYDRYLSDTKFHKIVICRTNLMLDEIAVDEFDVAMDIIVNEEETIRR